jgi:glycosyltransferase involved in cell wall biosynthesis
MTVSNNLNFSILIATKNRPNELALLLDSITKSTILPNKLVIVFTGADINQIVSDYASKLNIELIRSEIASQIFQKSEGIKALKSNDGWVLFLDDDVLIDSKAIEILANQYICNDKYSQYVGFGLAIKNINYRNLNFLSKLLLYIFKLYSFKPGAITKSGHPQSYLHQNFDSDVSWLNGISLWRSDVLQTYINADLVVDHSSYEDVIFSYNLSTTSKLRFLSDVFVTSQMQMAPQITSTLQFIHGSYLRYYFVDKHKEFSKYWLLVAQILRNIEYIFMTEEESSFYYRIKIALDIWFSLFHASINKIAGIELISSKLKNVNSSNF